MPARAALPLEQGGDQTLVTQLASGRPSLEQLCGAALDEPYDEMLLECFHSLKSTAAGEHLEAYTHLERACSSFQSAFEKDTAWSLPALHKLDLGLRRAAQRADVQLKEKGKKKETATFGKRTGRDSKTRFAKYRRDVEISEDCGICKCGQ